MNRESTAIKLDDVCEFIVDCLHATAPTQSTGFPLIRTPNIGKGRLTLTNVFRVSREVYKTQTSRATPIKNDLIMAREAPAGNVAIIKNEQSVCLGQRTVHLRPNTQKINPDFLCYFLLAPKQQFYLLSRATGATVAHVNMKDIRNLVLVNLPPLPRQQKIAKILSSYDDLIENNLKRIKLLEESAKQTYEEWFLRFKIDGKKLEVDPTTGLPFGWEKKSITKFDSFKQDKSKVKEFKGEKTYYATADTDGTSISGDGEIIDWSNKPSRAQIKPNNNSVWFARMSNTYKVLCFNSKNINIQNNSVLSSGFAGFKAKNNLCLPFLFFTINSDFFHELKNLFATGATQVSLNNDSMNFIKVTEPKLDLVESFGKRTLPLIEEISVLRSKNELLKEARDILLPRLMTGIINTNDLDIAL